MNFVDAPLKKVVCYLNPEEFHSTWLGNKAVYRTRMAIADGGELIVLAPGVKIFGEDPDNDKMIRKYGYCDREKRHPPLPDAGRPQAEPLRRRASYPRQLRRPLLHHLLHPFADGRRGARASATNYMPYDEAVKRYDPARLKDGFNTLPDGEEIYYISNPALGLWADRNKY